MTRRLVLVPASGPGDPLRRYRLARLDEIALGTPIGTQGDAGPKPIRPVVIGSRPPTRRPRGL